MHREYKIYFMYIFNYWIIYLREVHEALEITGHTILYLNLLMIGKIEYEINLR